MIVHAGWWLLVGAAVALAGAFCPPYAQWYAPQAEAMRVIAAHPIGWRCIHAGFALGTVAIAVGFATLACALRTPVLIATATCFAIATVSWLAVIEFRVAVTTWAADRLVATETIPDSYAPLQRWSSAAFAVFVALAYGAVALAGIGLLRTSTVPRWLGWGAVAIAAVGAPLVGLTGPWVVYVPIGALGAWLAFTA